MTPRLAVAALAAIPGALEAFDDASAELLRARLLQQRIDRKYLLPKRLLDPLLTCLSADYRIVRSAGWPAATYETWYFDTPERQMYEDHRRGRGRRYKVRVRHHVERKLTFLEVKRKDVSDRTTKARLERRFGDCTLDAEAAAFIERHSPYRAARLSPRLFIAFRRATLVGEAVNERLTLDWDLELGDDRRRVSLPHVVIAEVKQGRYSHGSPAVATLRTLHVREQAISKYCLASVTLAGVRGNTFRPALRAVERLSA